MDGLYEIRRRYYELEQGDPPSNPWDTDRNGWNALHWACRHRRYGDVKALLAHGKPSFEDLCRLDRERQYAPIHIAVDQDQEDIVKLLLVHGTPVNIGLTPPIPGVGTPLTIARSKAMIDLLINAGADHIHYNYPHLEEHHKTYRLSFVRTSKTSEWYADLIRPRDSNYVAVPAYVASGKLIDDLWLTLRDLMGT